MIRTRESGSSISSLRSVETWTNRPTSSSTPMRSLQCHKLTAYQNIADLSITDPICNNCHQSPQTLEFCHFVIFTFNTISILSISHFIFLLNVSVLFSLCARLNWQFVCQFLSANSPLYCIVLYRTLASDMPGYWTTTTPNPWHNCSATGHADNRSAARTVFLWHGTSH